MIHAISSNKSTFKTIRFNPDFNVILAERTDKSSTKDSRNGLGKSTLNEIIHFCLGGLKGSTLKKSKLNDWTFTIELDLGSKKYSISRNTKDQTYVEVNGDYSEWPLQPERSDDGDYLTNEKWKKILGKYLFNRELEYEQKFSPTTRSLLSYFIRPGGKDGGYIGPTQQYKQQATWDVQVHNAYLLDLDWEFASKWQILREEEKFLNDLKKQTSTGLLSDLVGNVGELEAKKIRLVDKIEKEEGYLHKFRVHEQYSDLEKNSNEITKSIHKLVNQNIIDGKLLDYYSLSLVEEVDAEPKQVKQIYEEAGLIFPEKIVKRIDDVLKFHEKIVNNRKDFLGIEIKSLKRQIKNKEKEIQNLNLERSEILHTLKTHGALEEFLQLQSQHQKLIGELRDTEIKLKNLKKFEEGKSALVIEQEQLYQNASADLNERQLQKENAIRIFNSYSEHLYKSPGILSINVEKTGYKFDINIEREGSFGFEMMKIFCYDLMLAKLWSKKVKSTPFLMHDSIIFADVDERQTALALQLAASESKNERFQYICTMNSDVIPRNDLPDDFNFDDFVVRTFTDATEDGGLLGIRF